MNRTYISIYEHHIRQFVEMKRTLGFKFTTTAVILRQIDTLANKTGETSLGITKGFADTWSKKRSYESDAYHYDRVRILAMLSSYMNDRGVPSFIPKVPRYKPSTFIPYIYSAKDYWLIGFSTICCYISFFLFRSTFDLSSLVFTTGLCFMERIGDSPVPSCLRFLVNKKTR